MSEERCLTALIMAKRELNEGPGPQAKRTGREAADPKNEPEEFADDMRVNRFTPPPDPEEPADESKSDRR